MSIYHQLYLLAAVVGALILLTSRISLDSGWDLAHQFHQPADFFHAPRGKILRPDRAHPSALDPDSNGLGRMAKQVTEGGCLVQLQSATARCRINPLVKYWDEVTDCYVSPLRRVHGLQVRNHRARRFVVFQPDEGGWNNIRMALEVVVLIAQVRAAVCSDSSCLSCLSCWTNVILDCARCCIDNRAHPGDPPSSGAVSAQREQGLGRQQVDCGGLLRLPAVEDAIGTTDYDHEGTKVIDR